MKMTRANKQRLIFGPILLIVGVVLLIFWKNAPGIIHKWAYGRRLSKHKKR